MLSGIIWLIVGVVGGAVGMFFVFRNNKKTFEEKENELINEINELKDKLLKTTKKGKKGITNGSSKE
jgi:uncharacterized protein YneF (UPF0154 family)